MPESLSTCIFCHEELQGQFMDIHPRCLMRIYGMVTHENVSELLNTLRKEALKKTDKK